MERLGLLAPQGMMRAIPKDISPHKSNSKLKPSGEGMRDHLMASKYARFVARSAKARQHGTSHPSETLRVAGGFRLGLGEVSRVVAPLARLLSWPRRGALHDCVKSQCADAQAYLVLELHGEGAEHDSGDEYCCGDNVAIGHGAASCCWTPLSPQSIVAN